ncbi:ketopantoate reductase family protein [Roseateles sp. LYH14W]|uniref:2-dehydropantoate 2-reductase n=1 Tax=Pelomonas parva TaxID=3299032 RepID=A0ABW7F8M2_9BURK
MKIAILGAGAMGSLFGGLLAEAGQSVTLIDINAAHLGAIRDTGLRLTNDSGDRHILALKVCRPEQATEPPDLLVVFTKTLHTVSALKGVQHLLSSDTQVLSLQNGLGNVEAISEFVPAGQIMIGVTTWPADMVGPGHVHSHGQGAIHLMTADGSERPALAACVDSLSTAGLRCEADPEVWVSIWEKVAFNAALNSICAVTRCTVDQLDLLPEGRALALQVVTEAIAVARASGVAADLARTSAKVVNAIKGHRGHMPSMLQDVLAGRPTEVASINGAIVAAGRRLGVATTCTATLLELVRLIQARAVVGTA